MPKCKALKMLAKRMLSVVEGQVVKGAFASIYMHSAIDFGNPNQVKGAAVDEEGRLKQSVADLALGIWIYSTVLLQIWACVSPVHLAEADQLEKRKDMEPALLEQLEYSETVPVYHPA